MSERAQTSETKIVRAAICPAIGIARVGNSESEYFLAPEVADPPPETPGFYRDPTGALKRQAVRFRVYGLNAAARPVAELTADNAEIRWNLHLANRPGRMSGKGRTLPLDPRPANGRNRRI